MNVYKSSKPINKPDDASKLFIIQSLKGEETHGFDVDSIYFCEGQWYIFEYLKCDKETETPYTSDPKKYPWNWKKFYSLYVLAKHLNGKLILVNYSTKKNDYNLVKLMEVVSFDYDKAKAYDKTIHKGHYEYMKLNCRKTDRTKFANYLKNINRRSTLPNINL